MDILFSGNDKQKVYLAVNKTAGVCYVIITALVNVFLDGA